MSQLYIAQETPLMCTSGRRLIGIGVSSQSSVYLKNGSKLMATEDDRFKDNFICPQMMIAGAVAGVGIAAAFGGGLFVLAAAAWAGSALIDDCLNICSFLTKGSDWTNTHQKVRVEGKKPLLQTSTLNCFLGGTVKFHLPTPAKITELSNAASMAQDSYNDNSDEPAQIGEYTRMNTDDQAVLDEMFDPGTFTPEDFNTNRDDGFYASLYKNNNTGEYFVAFRGSEPKGMQFYHDWFIEDGGQAFGAQTPQIEKTMRLADKMNQATNGNVSFTGHSLGGGNSAMASYYTGLPAYTFNTRGVHQNTLDFLDENNAVGSTSNITNYSTSNDILNALQNNREGLLSTLAISRIPGLNNLALFGGLTGAVPRALGEQNEIFGYIPDNEGMNLKTFGSGHSAYADAVEAMIATINTNVIAVNP
ncbi:PAAR-like protein [Chryseobacterium sp. CFBP8996]|uniref:PAAR-like protein n=1 Tax=Chryseobacterium sp. CFBP8996 TaxID=3096529 RepID=UPI002A69D973|nr:PAAR-like protein [Chryseobacterium sp. CFBP8996]MDY0931683.1 PAAR-like protein [Chryseobacterium sp. CFBP8996]